MTRDEAKKLLPVIQAFADGKDIECRREDGTWGILREPIFGAYVDRYRIKPEPLERWVVKNRHGDEYLYYDEGSAKNQMLIGSFGPYTIYHMREVIE